MLAAGAGAATSAGGFLNRRLFSTVTRGVSSLKVPWRRDRVLDAALIRDRNAALAARVVREIDLAVGRRLPLSYLERRRDRLRLTTRAETFIRQYPSLLQLSPGRKTLSGPLIPFVHPTPALESHLAAADALRHRHALPKLIKLLLLSTSRSLPTEKLFSVKRAFGFPNDFVVSIVADRPDLFRLVGDGEHIELISFPAECAKSAVEAAADAAAEVTGVRLRPNFKVKLPRGFYLKKEMREWMRDWLELPYVSPYDNDAALQLNPASPQAEKRRVAVLHEVLSLAIDRRLAVPSIGKFYREFRLSNAFATTFTRHPGIFYVSLKGGVKTAVLREAYDEQGMIVDMDPLLEIKKQFVELMNAGNRKYLEMLQQKREELQKDMELMAAMNANFNSPNDINHDVDDAADQGEWDGIIGDEDYGDIHP